MNRLAILALGGFLVTQVWGAAEAGPDLNNPQNLGIAQDTVRVEANNVQGNLASIVDEMKRNGLANLDAESIRKTLRQLGTLTEDDMQKVIDALKQASATTDKTEQKKNLSAAYDGQLRISEQLKQISGSFDRNTAMSGIALRVKELLRRQVTVQRDTVKLQNFSQQDPGFASLFEVANGEQKSIHMDTSMLSYLIVPNVKDLPPEVNAVLEKASAFIDNSKIDTEAGQAVNDLSDKKFEFATQSQQKVIGILTQLLGMVNQLDDLMSQLQRAKEHLDNMLAEQKNLEKRSEAGAANKADPERQDSLADDAKVAQSLLKTSNPQAATEMDRAKTSMEKSSAELHKQADGKTSIDAQKEAIASLENAQKNLDQQIKDLAEKMQKSQEERLKDVQKLAEETKKAAEEQQKLAQTPNQQKQEELAKKTEQLQKDALLESQEAAQKISQANQDMQKQQPDLKKAAEELQDASKQLAQKAEEMKKQIAEQKQAEQQQQQMADMQKNLQEMNKNLQDQKNNQQNQKNAEQMQQMAKQMQDMQQNQKDANSKQQMQDMQNKMQQSAKNLQQNNQQQAMQLNQQTLQQMQQLQADMKQQQQQRQNQNMPFDPQNMQPYNQTAQDQKGQMLKGAAASKFEVAGLGLTVGKMKPKDREALNNFANDKIPEGYEDMVKQYRENLSGGEAATK